MPDTSAESLLEILTLQEVGTASIATSGTFHPEYAGETGARVFMAPSQRMPQRRVFGGQVLAQCVMAAGLTVRDAAPTRAVHSLHGYFIRPGDDTLPIRFAVENLRDGNSFSTRRVHALQNGQVILSMISSFQEPAGGLDHQDPMPHVPAPEDVEPYREELRRRAYPGTARETIAARPVELRHVEGNLYTRSIEDGRSRQHVWMRAAGGLPDDDLLHAAVLAYASDYSLLEPILRRHNLGWADPRLRVASLDHAMWFHRPVRMDDWLLYAEESPSAQGGRGLGIGRMFRRDGTLVATVAQEGMMRVKES